MSVKRYSGERDSLFDVEYVLATDFDALAKRLEEAERLLKLWAHPDGDMMLLPDTQDFLKARP